MEKIIITEVLNLIDQTHENGVTNTFSLEFRTSDGSLRNLSNAAKYRKDLTQQRSNKQPKKGGIQYQLKPSGIRIILDLDRPNNHPYSVPHYLMTRFNSKLIVHK